VAKFTNKIRDNASNISVDKWRPRGPDAGHRNTELAVIPNLSTVSRILRVQLQHDNLISPNVKIEENNISKLYLNFLKFKYVFWAHINYTVHSVLIVINETHK
jgi:hypothetical protein